MTKRMLIDAAHADETRVVLLNHQQVYDYDFVTSAKSQIKGNIYLAKITRVEPSLQAAFVEYGGGKQGFLPFAEIHPDYYQLPAEDRRKLLEEQIAEAEAEEAAEDEAFEREQAAREARRSRGEEASSEEDDAEFIREEEPLGDDALIATEVATHFSDDAGDSAVIASLPALTPVEVPEIHAVDIRPLEDVQPLSAESFSISSDPLPEENPAAYEGAFSAEDALAISEQPDAAATAGDEGDEPRSRGGRDRGAFRRYRIQEVVKRNQIVLVQVIKEERGNKGASLTTYISLAGRAAVLMPNSPKGGGISRKITDRETRRRLKEVASEMRTHKGMSVIIRTAGIDRTKAEIRRDFEYLVSLWNSIRETTLASTAPALIYEEGNLVKRALRDLYTSDVEEVIIEGEDAYNDGKAFMKMLMPSHVGRIKHYTEPMPIFSFAGVEDQLAAMTEPQVRLPSGGYLVIHPTEALISIDVNSGRSTTERNVEETAIKTNLEAAYEVARQLRLRDLAGLIVIDFIDMGYGKHRKQVERAMKDALRADRAKIQVGRISMFGLMELSRQRLRPSIAEAMGVICPHCKGTGYIHSVETIGMQVIRALEKEAATKEYGSLRVTTHPDAALYLLNEKRAVLQSLEQRYGVNVVILMDASLITGNFRIVKITHEGREIVHEPALANQQNRRGGGGGRGRRGRRGGREDGSGVVLNFDGVATVDPADAAYAEEYRAEEGGDEFIRADNDTSDEEGGPRGRRDGRRRGGRNRRRRGGEADGNAPAEGVELSANGPDGDAEASETYGSENGDARGDRDGRRRRGRRGGRGRNRERGQRSPESGENDAFVGGDIAAAADAAIAAERATVKSFVPQPPSSFAQPPVNAPASEQKSFVIPLSEAQTNPAAVASAIRSESSAAEDTKTKRKGWWSRVLEN